VSPARKRVAHVDIRPDTRSHVLTLNTIAVPCCQLLTPDKSAYRVASKTEPWPPSELTTQLVFPCAAAATPAPVAVRRPCVDMHTGSQPMCQSKHPLARLREEVVPSHADAIERHREQRLGSSARVVVARDAAQATQTICLDLTRATRVHSSSVLPLAPSPRSWSAPSRTSFGGGSVITFSCHPSCHHRRCSPSHPSCRRRPPPCRRRSTCRVSSARHPSRSPSC